ncbi:MAG TPA: TolC family protein [Thermoanaerobaculia bacterium]|nr:TolC family protein [Thermoanaerobaculia bacterium]
MTAARRGRALAAWAALALAAAWGASGQDAPLTLAQALELAARHNETPHIAAARLERAEAVRREAIATLLPALTLTSSYTRRAREVTRIVDDEEFVIQARGAESHQAVADATVFDARAFPLVRAASRDLEAQRLESAELVRDLSFDVAEAFFAVLSAERLRAAAGRRIQVAEATVSDASIRRDAGLANLNDVTRSELELAAARLALTQAENLAANARLSLGFLIGVPAMGPLAEPGAEAETPPAAGELEQRALAGRADLQAREERAAALLALSREPLMRSVPALGVRGTFRQTNETGLSGREQDWNVAATLTWELFDGGERYAQADQRRAEHREAVLQTEALRRLIGLEVRTALADLETAQGALGQAEVQARVAAQNAEEVADRFSNGLATALERADAAVAAFEADVEVERQRFALRLAELALERAVGGAPESPALLAPDDLDVGAAAGGAR